MGRLTAPERPGSLRSANRTALLHHARSCYDHLAGTAGVALTDALLYRGALIAALRRRCVECRPGGRALRVTRTGHDWLRGLGVQLPPEHPRYLTA